MTYFIETFIPNVEQNGIHFLCGSCLFLLDGEIRRVPISINVGGTPGKGLIKYQTCLRERAFRVEYIDGSFDWAEYQTNHLGENGTFLSKWNNSHPKQKKVKRVLFN